jgi:hypothetical protein
MIKRSIPSTLKIQCEDVVYAEGVKDGVIWALENLLHECDIIMRMMPTVEAIENQKEKADALQEDDAVKVYSVRARFTVREKHPSKPRGEWIKTFSAFYEEEIDDKFETDRDWVASKELNK